jgi:tetratricopeptide (TPR) repeat protein
VHWIAAIAVSLFLFAGIGAASADQDDPRLAGLFERLQDTTDPDDARDIEYRIWKIWIEIDDPELGEMMALGILAMRHDRLGVARSMFDELIGRRPDFAEAWNKRATVNYLIGDYQASLDDIAATLAREPRHFGALSGRGLVYQEIGDDKAALASFEAALAVNPHLEGARRNAEALRLLDRPI